MRVLLVKLSTQRRQDSLQLLDVDSSVIVDITRPKQLQVRNVSLAQDGQQFEHGLVLEMHVVVRAIHGVVLLPAAVVGFKRVLELLHRDVAFHVFVQDQHQS